MRAFLFDLKRKPPEERRWSDARKAERSYGAQLRKVARQIGELVKHADLSTVAGANDLAERLNAYGEIIEPWSKSVAERMIAEVSRRDRQVWRAYSAEMGRLLEREIQTAPTGLAMRRLLAEQVGLIKSLPLEAAERVQRLSVEALSTGRRAEEIAKQLAATGEVTMSRARTIARTEVGRASTELQRARAQHVGSTHFEWITAGDSDVRESHKRLNGRTFRWDDPPESDPGHRALPGAIWNCRCFARPIIPD